MRFHQAVWRMWMSRADFTVVCLKFKACIVVDDWQKPRSNHQTEDRQLQTPQKHTNATLSKTQPWPTPGSHRRCLCAPILSGYRHTNTNADWVKNGACFCYELITFPIYSYGYTLEFGQGFVTPLFAGNGHLAGYVSVLESPEIAPKPPATFNRRTSANCILTSYSIDFVKNVEAFWLCCPSVNDIATHRERNSQNLSPPSWIFAVAS